MPSIPVLTYAEPIRIAQRRYKRHVHAKAKARQHTDLRSRMQSTGAIDRRYGRHHFAMAHAKYAHHAARSHQKRHRRAARQRLHCSAICFCTCSALTLRLTPTRPLQCTRPSGAACACDETTARLLIGLLSLILSSGAKDMPTLVHVCTHNECGSSTTQSVAVDQRVLGLVHSTVVSTTAHTCVVSFDFACAPDGSAFEPERLATKALLLLL